MKVFSCIKNYQIKKYWIYKESLFSFARITNNKTNNKSIFNTENNAEKGPTESKISQDLNKTASLFNKNILKPNIDFKDDSNYNLKGKKKFIGKKNENYSEEENPQQENIAEEQINKDKSDFFSKKKKNAKKGSNESFGNNNKPSAETKDANDKKKKEKIKEDFLYGINSCEAGLKLNLRKISMVNILNNFRANTPDRIRKIIEMAKGKGIKVRYVTRESLDKMTLNKSHEGVCVKSYEREYIDLKKFNDFQKYLKKSSGNIVVLMQNINETFTIGNILKTGVYLGVDHFIVSKDDKHLINGSLAKASSGASETTDLFCIKFVKNFLVDAAKKDWTIICAGVDKDNPGVNISQTKDSKKGKLKETNDVENNDNEPENVNSVIECKEINLKELKFDANKNYILLLRNEGSNFETCHYKVYIPPLLDEKMVKKHPFDFIESMNTSVILGLVLTKLRSDGISI